jgi:glycosyltransferase involved in cell wall biosynthesis
MARIDVSKLRVAMIAPPWLPVPPKGYGGIENVIAALVPALMKKGVEVELFTTGDSTLRATKKHYLYETGQYEHIHRPQYEAAPIVAAHVLFALNIIREAGDFDVIHDHNNFYGPLALANADQSLPPVVHTLHNPRFVASTHLDPKQLDNLMMWQQLGVAKKMFFVGISNSQTKKAPSQLKHLMLPAVYNALDIKEFPYIRKKSDYFLTMARHHPEKGQHIAVKACLELGYRLKMAGVIGDITTHKKLMMELANPLSLYRSLPDFRYYSDQIFPYQDDDMIQYVGEIGGKRRADLLGRAKALLFPIQWDEPFGMAPIEALACGTPVVAMARGALPEIVQHGVNGFLAKNQAEFKYFMTKVGEIDPRACRESAKQKFSSKVMAQKYLQHYKTVIKRSL